MKKSGGFVGKIKSIMLGLQQLVIEIEGVVVLVVVDG